MAHNSRNYAVKNFSEDAVYSDLDELLRRLIKQTR